MISDMHIDGQGDGDARVREHAQWSMGQSSIQSHAITVYLSVLKQSQGYLLLTQNNVLLLLLFYLTF